MTFTLWERQSFFMAIVKTTPKETGSSAPNGKTPPSTKPVVATPTNRAAVRPSPTRGGVQTAPKPSRAFISDTIAELKKVVWPSVDDVRSGTIVTILLLIVFGAYIFGLDAFFAWLFESLDLYS